MFCQIALSSVYVCKIDKKYKIVYYKDFIPNDLYTDIDEVPDNITID